VSDLAQVCGNLLVGGFDGTELPDEVRRELAAGRRAGVILFKRNLAAAAPDGTSLFGTADVDIAQVSALNAAIAAVCPEPPFIAVDQEGGRVARLGRPVVKLPPMRELGTRDDVAATEACALELGRQLAALGFNLDFAPVLDVDTNPQNPIIGDRAFGRDPRTVMRHGVAFLRGLQSAGVLACAKHFPGHGDTSTDSHLELPAIDHPRERLAQVELPPFRAASGAGVAAIMTAHVVCRALEDGVPATFSHAVCTSLLRADIGFAGVLFSDDLEMGAIAKHGTVEDAALRAVAAGCDVVLVCRDLAAQARAHEALVREAEKSPAFRDRCREAAERSLRVRRLARPRTERDARRLRDLFDG
jgi:beta-N-acetylhexosaminidase